MGFSEAVQTCFRKYVVFSGRARRSEFWFWFLFTVVAGIAASILDGIIFGNNSARPFSTVISLALVLPGLAVSFRRLHDVDRSGWWVLLNLIPFIGSLILIFVFYIKDSQPGDNQYGPNPKGVAGTPAGVAGEVPGYPSYGPYGQNPYGQYLSSTNAQSAPYGQPPQGPGSYGQPPAPYGQPPQTPATPSPYGQPPHAPAYGQPPAPYGQPPQPPQPLASPAPYGQPPQPPVPDGQASGPPQAPYGQSPEEPKGRGPQTPNGPS